MSTTPTLPASIDSERALLGAIILSNGENYAQAAALVSADSFYLDSNRRIFAAMGALQSIDLVTLCEELIRRNELDQVGGFSYVSTLTDGMPRIENVRHYCDIMRNRAGLRGVVHIANATAQRALQSGDSTPEEIAAESQAMLSELVSQNATGGLITVREVFDQNFPSIDSILNHRASDGIHTGFRRIDDMTGGLHPGELTLIAARPSIGKTALALNIAQNIAEHCAEQSAVAFFSLEMTKSSLFMRLLCSEARVDSHRISTGFLTNDDRAHLTHSLPHVLGLPLYIDDQSNLRPEVIAARSKGLRSQVGGLSLVVVDYLQLIDASLGKNDSRVQEISRVSRAMKRMAKDLDCPVLALCQLNRAPEDRDGAPRLSDLRESGQLEQDADAVFALWKPSAARVHRSDIQAMAPVSDDGITKLSVLKQRNGPTGEIDLVFLKRYTRFETAAEGIEPEGEDPQAWLPAGDRE